MTRRLLARAALLCLSLAWACVPPEPEPTLQTRLFKDGRPPVELTQGATIHAGDELYMTVTPQRNLYLYVINEDAAGVRTAIYPCRNWGRSRPLAAGRPHRLPPPLFGRQTFWPIQSMTSLERLLVLASTRSLDLLEPAVVASESPEPCASPVTAEANRSIEQLIEGQNREVWISTYELEGTTSPG